MKGPSIRSRMISKRDLITHFTSKYAQFSNIVGCKLNICKEFIHFGQAIKLVSTLWRTDCSDVMASAPQVNSAGSRNWKWQFKCTEKKLAKGEVDFTESNNCETDLQ